MAKVSAVIITKNEETNIADCIASARKLCDEVIVVDSESTDRTVEIAKSLGAKTYVQEYLGDGPQKNFGLQYATNDWILSIDADERLEDEAVAILSAIDYGTTQHDAYYLRRKNLIGSRWIRYNGWYPDNLVRLYNKQKTRFADVPAHSRVPAEYPQYLKADIIHYSYKYSGELFVKADRFSSRGAKDLYRRKKKANNFSPFTHGLIAFLRQYVFKLGVLGGVDGFTVALSSSVNSYLKWAKLLELQNDEKAKKSLNPDGIW
jgi:glycosyltransferase involved in cell wall biosynthesis